MKVIQNFSSFLNSGFRLFIFLSLIGSAHLFSMQIIGPFEAEDAYYDTDIKVIGRATFLQAQVHELTVCGSLSAKKFKVLGSLVVIGPTEFEELSCSEMRVTGSCLGRRLETRFLDIVGPMSVSKANIQGTCQVIGPVYLRDSNLDKLEVTSEEVILEDVTLSSIHFKKNKDKKAKLTLKGKTTVLQGIVFDNGAGEVVIEGDHVSILGVVEGALPFDIP